MPDMAKLPARVAHHGRLRRAGRVAARERSADRGRHGAGRRGGGPWPSARARGAFWPSRGEPAVVIVKSRALRRPGQHLRANPHRSPALRCQQQHACHGVRQVVVCRGCVVDAVSAAAGRAPFQAAELRSQARQVQQLDLAAVQERQRVPVQVGLRLL